MQSIYTLRQSGGMSLKEGEDHLRESLLSVYELYIHQLSFLMEFVDFARVRIEDAKLKYLPTEEDLNPNTRFIENRLIKQFSENKSFKLRLNNLKISWAEEQEMIRKLYNIFKESEDYKEYMSAKESSYEADRMILVRFIKKFASRYELLDSFYEEQSVFWADDFETANMMVLKTLKLWQEDYDETKALPSLYNTKDKLDPKEDEKFTIDLYRKALLKGDQYEELIESFTKGNWEIDRIAMLDMIMLKMACTELEFFPSIPVKVTINEYVEMAKNYSTDKSKVFVNGIMYKIINYLKDEDRLNKIGRGLAE
jgi:N utilization substance protein B